MQQHLFVAGQFLVVADQVQAVIEVQAFAVVAASAEPLAMMLLVRTSLLNRKGTSELSAEAVDDGRLARFAAPTAVPVVPASAPKSVSSARVNCPASPFSTVKTLTSESMFGDLSN